MLRIKPGVEGTVAPRGETRSEVATALAKRRARTEEYKKRREEAREERSRLLPKKVDTFEYPNHAWVPFIGSDAMKRLIENNEEKEEKPTTQVSTTRNIVGYAPVQRERKEWASNLKTHILNILVPVFEGDEGFAREDLSRMYDEVVPVWHSAFTNYSYNPNEGKNYEQGEKIGDSVAKLSLQDTMIDARPTITEHELTVAVNTILAKEQQAEVSTTLDLPKYMRTNYPDVNTDESEDLFESLVGALYVMGNRESVGLGAMMVSRFLWYLDSIGLINITDEVYDTPPKTQISILFKTLSWGEPIATTTREKDGWRARILINSDTRRVAARTPLYRLDIYDAKAHVEEGKPYQPVPQQHLTTLMSAGEVGNATGETEARALYNAYKNAVDRLKKMGIIREATFLEHFRLNQDFYRVNEEAYAKAYFRAKGEGYDNIFSTDAKIRYDKNKTVGYINLIGIRRLPSGEYTRDVIYTIAIPVSRGASGFIQATGQGTKISYEYDKKEVRRILYEMYAKDQRITTSEPQTEESYAIPEDEEDEEEGDEGEE